MLLLSLIATGAFFGLHESDVRIVLDRIMPIGRGVIQLADRS